MPFISHPITNLPSAAILYSTCCMAAGDDQTGWVQFGEVLHIADKAINEGSATPMIIVMPDANTGTRGYFNDFGK